MKKSKGENGKDWTRKENIRKIYLFKEGRERCPCEKRLGIPLKAGPPKLQSQRPTICFAWRTNWVYPVRNNVPLGFESQRLEFLTGFTLFH